MANFTFDPTLPKMTDAVKTILTDGLVADGEIMAMDVLFAIDKFRDEGPYCMAKRLGLLKNNSAEDMAIEFMSFANQIFSNTF